MARGVCVNICSGCRNCHCIGKSRWPWLRWDDWSWQHPREKWNFHYSRRVASLVSLSILMVRLSPWWKSYYYAQSILWIIYNILDQGGWKQNPTKRQSQKQEQTNEPGNEGCPMSISLSIFSIRIKINAQQIVGRERQLHCCAKN